MNYETIQKAIENGTLRKYDLTSAAVGDKVLGWEPGEVLAIYGEDVVIGWDLADGKSADIFLTNQGHGVYLAPLCWVEDKPVYKGDVLYRQNGKQVTVRCLNGDGTFLLFEEGGRWTTDGSISKLSWTDPTILCLVEGKPVRKGDVVFSRDGDKVTITDFEMGVIITTPGQVMGETQWTADYLSWTDPTILFEVEGKPVRKGDVLYSPGGVVVKRVISHVVPYETYDKKDNRVTALRVWGDDGIWDKPEKLTWTKPHIVINGFNVPEPVREPLSEGTMYYVPHLFSGRAEFYSWAGDDVDHHFLRSGLVHLTGEAAIAHAQALISLTKS